MSQIKMAPPILDIGCSDGVFGEVLFQSKKGAVDMGIDIDELALLLSKNKKVYKKTIKVDARNVPFPDQSFATVFSNQGLEHIKDVDEVFQEVRRVLKDRGKFVFLVPTVFLDDYWLTSAIFKIVGLKNLSRILHQVRNKLFSHENLLPLSIWRRKLKKVGFRLISYQYIGSRKRYFLSDLFWTLRIPQMLLTRALRRRILFPRRPVLFLAKLLKNFLKKGETKKLKKGPTMLIIAQKI